MSKRVHADVSRERRTLVDAHTRHVEQLAAGVAHEIRNPITAAKSLVQQMGEDPTARENVEYAGVALAELERVERSISHLLRFAREEEVAHADVAVAEVIEGALATLDDRCVALGVRVERDVAALRPLRGDPEKLRRVLINLIGNALDAFAEAKTPSPTLVLQAGENLAGSEVWLRVRDNGPGMDAEKLARIWSPFYTLVAAAEGRTAWMWNNLGLSSSFGQGAIMEGNSIYTYSAPGCGFGAEISSANVTWSRVANNRFYGGGTAVLSSVSANGGGTEGNTFNALTTLPAWAGPGDPTQVPLPNGLRVIAGEGKCPSL